MSELRWLPSLRRAGSVVALLLLSPPNCLDRRELSGQAQEVQRCATCHGDPQRAGDALLRAAPPRDLAGGTDPSFPGVGAHAIHLYASATHPAFACQECHRVPETTDAPGHANHGSPAALFFGVLAKHDGHDPAYDPRTRTCLDSYCHGPARPVWNAPRDSAAACGSCHGLPPPLPHPQSDRCSVCHADVVDEARRIIAPELHVDGIVEYRTDSCVSCHGSGSDPAPPPDTQGNTSPSALGVGAHRAHLSSELGRPLECNECHVVPDKVEEPGHIEGLPARVLLSGVAETEGRMPVWQHAAQTCTNTWCHGPSPGSSGDSPSWVSQSSLACDSCHGAPPALPHPQVTECAVCHGAVVGADNQSIIDPMRHVDGVVDVAVDEACTSCHGGVNPAPPRDLQGNTATTFAGVGAHQTHLLGTPRSRPVPCGECHQVPSAVLDPGHVDSARPAELTFAGVALANGAHPVYENGSCTNTTCHGAVMPDGKAGGGTHTVPLWTAVDGSQAACGNCHGLPPPAPHPIAYLNPVCSACHEDIAPDNQTFVRPDLHVDGQITFALP